MTVYYPRDNSHKYCSVAGQYFSSLLGHKIRERGENGFILKRIRVCIILKTIATNIAQWLDSAAPDDSGHQLPAEAAKKAALHSSSDVRTPLCPRSIYFFIIIFLLYFLVLVLWLGCTKLKPNASDIPLLCQHNLYLPPGFSRQLYFFFHIQIFY